MYQCLKCGEIGTEEEMLGHHHSPDMTSFIVGTVVGLATGFFIFTQIGRRTAIAAASKVTGMAREALEKRIEEIEK